MLNQKLEDLPQPLANPTFGNELRVLTDNF